ncbi:3-phosphoshikimate 1-carboxyvinyltransferase [Actinomyces culturomici]|uniref:3-phosphoshikimate 1-carboxyvinyltransferase n=1 Tax=Actinomyces culturomici TaxID=1926276 RepID=UPI000E204545|nr:3-phosphoshikimate 1-carboxyvinyltransferase [Actinomyces culturomici]
MTVDWSAPASPGPLDASVEIPGSKSQTARALYLAAVAQGPSVLRGVLDSRDTRLFIAALRAFGARIDVEGTTARVAPLDPARIPGGAVDCGLAGTVMRFLPPLAALSSSPIRFDGDEAARVRPLSPLLDALSLLGARIEYEGEFGFLPFTITGPLRAPDTGLIEVDASASSQFLSALLLVAPLLARPASGAPLVVRAPGRVVSLPHVEMTLAALRARGVDVSPLVPESGAPGAPGAIDEGGARAWQIVPGVPAALDETIEPDLSNAGPFLAAAMTCGGRVRIPNWPTASTQAGDAWREILPAMGGTVSREGAGLVVSGPGIGAIRGIDLDMSRIGELAPTVAALAALANGPSLLTGIAHLRGHETDRLAALATELRAAGADVDELPDGLAIRPGALVAARHRAYGDHRMATFAAILGLAAPGTTLDDIASTSKTLPDFPAMWDRLLGRGAAS